MIRTVTIACLALAAIAGAVTFLGRSGPELPGLDMRATAQEAEVDTSGIVEMTQGAEDAPVTMIEYASYTCPHCADFHENVFPQLKADYIDTGKVRFVYREVYFDRPGLWASMVARCGGEDRFFGITDMLFDQQQTWLQGDTGQAIADNLRKIGRMAGLDGDTIEACLNDADTARALVARFEETTAEDGIQATPTFVIDGEVVSNAPYSELKAKIDAALEG